jgi:hypothetical protein
MTIGFSPDSPFNILAEATNLPAPATLDGSEVYMAYKANNSTGPSGNRYVQVSGAKIAAQAGGAGKPAAVYNALTNTTSGSLSNAQTQPGGATFVVAEMTGTTAGDTTLTLPVLATLVTALGSSFVAGMSWVLRVKNTNGAAHNWTLTTASGWGTLHGTLAVPQNQWIDFVLTLTSATAGTVQAVGGGTVA